MREQATVQTAATDAGPISHAIFRVARLHKALAGRLLRESGLYPGQELVLMTLWEQGPQRQVDLAQAVESDAPTMARSISRLEKAGLVRRSPSPTDRRATIVEATEASLALRTKVNSVWTELEHRTVDGLSQEQRDEILASLALLESALTTVGR